MPLTLAPDDTTSAEGAALGESGRDQSTDSASRDQTRKSGPDRFVRHRISFIVPSSYPAKIPTWDGVSTTLAGSRHRGHHD
jgi:hypothetical protein